MLISLAHKFVFIATPKCASTAIEEMLRPYGSLAFTGTSTIKHTTLRDYQRFIKPFLAKNQINVDSFEIYALFREPCSWIRSWWRYRSRPELADPRHPRHPYYTGGIPLEKFVDEYLKSEPAIFARFGIQAQWVLRRKGDSDRLRLFRYEEIDKFLQHLGERVGRRLSLEKMNQSPVNGEGMPIALIERLRSVKPIDFQIYESIGDGLIDAVASWDVKARQLRLDSSLAA
jgi:hypothetical protein